MANDCAGIVQLCALRVARLDASGVPNPGADNLYITDSMVSLGITPVMKDGTEIQTPNGCSVNIVDYKTPKSYRRVDVELVLAIPDPELEEMIAGYTLLTLAGSTVGAMMPALATALDEDGVSLEGWSKRVINGKLATTNPYLRWVLPKTNNWTIGPRTLSDGSVGAVLNGEGYANVNWYDGPLNDWYGLTDIDMSAAFGYVQDTAVPDAACGYAVLAAS